MAKLVRPSIHLIASTSIDQQGLTGALLAIGAPHWRSDSDNPADILTEFAGKSCYMSFDTSLNANLTKVGGRDTNEYIQEGIIGQRHGSVLEHSSVTFLLANISRVVTHELVRHRAGTAFSQTSGRYVRTDEISMYLPRDIAELPGGSELFLNAIRAQEEVVRKMADVAQIQDKPFGIKKRLTSAFRRLVGNGVANNLVMTGNHRAWRHIIEMRSSSAHVEEETRDVVWVIADKLKKRFPTLYADMNMHEGTRDWVFGNPGV